MDGCCYYCNLFSILEIVLARFSKDFQYFQELAKEKADSMEKLLGYPTWLKDKNELDKYYDGVS